MGRFYSGLGCCRSVLRQNEKRRAVYGSLFRFAIKIRAERIKIAIAMKIEMTPRKYKIEIPEYGEFEVSPIGAGTEAEMRVISREIKELTAETEKYKDIVEKESNGEKLDQDSNEYQTALKLYKDLALKYDELRDLVYDRMRNLFKGKNVDKLFNDFTYDQILEIHGKATKENG